MNFKNVCIKPNPKTVVSNNRVIYQSKDRLIKVECLASGCNNYCTREALFITMNNLLKPKVLLFITRIIVVLHPLRPGSAFHANISRVFSVFPSSKTSLYLIHNKGFLCYVPFHPISPYVPYLPILTIELLILKFRI